MSQKLGTLIYIALCGGLLVSGTALADEAGNSLAPGKMGLRFAVPNSGATSIGGSYVLSADSALQFDVGLGWQSEKKSKNTLSGWGLKAGGYYVGYMTKTRVSPYYKGGVALAKNGGDANKGNDDLEFSLAGGVGAEFWVTKEFSLGGEALIGAPLTPVLKLGTAMSSLYATFYFDM